jgi:hypothetical protein
MLPNLAFVSCVFPVPTEIGHHKRGMRVGMELLPPPNRASASLAVLGPELDTDHAVVITAAVTMMANAMLLPMSSSTSGFHQPTWRKE